ncbi:Gfo/Idh/MocA family protein [Desulfonatronum thiodismutans]|uniref:Gfo/Idh/MocA family protein n=1 Tax=Desulfonatronum thiodismutans TaxID=159290 RepID=UPI0004ABEE14|nr:Gfo/Idh/MocA family oxidoreductase [Desulfonatronum thiodismutans]
MSNVIGKNFALIGAGGYVAPKHLRAIRDVGGKLVSAMDPADSVGILDSYFYDVEFFTEFERFDRHAEKMRRMGEEYRIHYVSICTPNYLHDAHMRFALRIGADAICEKPLVLNPWNLDVLEEMEQDAGRRVNCILQLRLHPSIIALKRKIDALPSGRKHSIDLSYITSRGRWYFTSWKGNPEKSGGIATNIGIHFFDMLLWIFGPPQHKEVHHSSPKRMAGYIELEKAKVRWYLSVDRTDLPQSAIEEGKPAYRSITIDGEELEFSGGFTDLHTQSYEQILAGNGFGLSVARPSIHLVSELRQANPVSRENGTVHPLLRNRL